MFVELAFFFFFNDTATTEIYTRSIVGSVRCVQETVLQHCTSGQRIPQNLARRRISSASDCASVPMYSALIPVSYTHLRAHETSLHLVCRLLLEKKKKYKRQYHKKKSPLTIIHIPTHHA
eukprot:TRINITY_DN49612_c0_g1_i4.p2 TRINITY_DN49612_c0_g1~~TRINITY_DN49612_c0_g1_i4.p2  ORF type:complete len:120 (+),score=27.45 TRINITY_DN49612_c0_g1_i4:63-422(+)